MYIQKWILPLSFVVGSVVIGFIFEKVILKNLRKLAEKTKWEGDDIIINAFQGWIVLIFVILGIYLAIINLSLNPALLEVIKKILLVF
ncbi:MAG: hypothetical protein ACP5QT_00985 [Brevinematia bacterium]